MIFTANWLFCATRSTSHTFVTASPPGGVLVQVALAVSVMLPAPVDAAAVTVLSVVSVLDEYWPRKQMAPPAASEAGDCGVVVGEPPASQVKKPTVPAINAGLLETDTLVTVPPPSLVTRPSA
ncbi:hypothetical protein LXA47_02280 [Massilia sp. P8910]|uniref:hypothetical protein n=1 Tax=Massilia antarctica TaxID=2765360 RepID=UPI001E59AC37|nr:hypothetical protein [Massilia antarctica]MCE3602439.1 hypothetical protein [Massilia antarctica]